MKRLYLLFFLIILISCREKDPKEEISIPYEESTWIERISFILDTLPDQQLTDLQPCDILVKPNLNWLPGTTSVPFGIGFGHAAIVIKGAQEKNEAALLSSALFFESQARDVAGEYQVRQVAGYVPGYDFSHANYNFKPENMGRYYRLRMDLTASQQDSIIAYLLSHDSGRSSTRAWKDHAFAKKDPSEEYWYCSLIIWQAFYDVLGIDLDANQGLYVYPNDLINSPYFNPDQDHADKRIRF